MLAGSQLDFEALKELQEETELKSKALMWELSRIALAESHRKEKSRAEAESHRKGKSRAEAKRDANARARASKPERRWSSIKPRAPTCPPPPLHDDEGENELRSVVAVGDEEAIRAKLGPPPTGTRDLM